MASFGNVSRMIRMRKLTRNFVCRLLVPLTLTAGPVQAQAQGQVSPRFWKFAPTPPMGWNSYDAYKDGVNEAQVLANAQAIKDHLRAHGWNYVVIDARWYDPAPNGNDFALGRRAGAKLASDAYGRMLPAPNRFPSAADGRGFKALADKLHAMGLKFGFHMMRGIPRESVLADTPIEGSEFKAADAANTKRHLRVVSGHVRRPQYTGRAGLVQRGVQALRLLGT